MFIRDYMTIRGTRVCAKSAKSFLFLVHTVHNSTFFTILHYLGLYHCALSILSILGQLRCWASFGVGPVLGRASFGVGPVLGRASFGRASFGYGPVLGLGQFCLGQFWSGQLWGASYVSASSVLTPEFIQLVSTIATDTRR